MTRKRIAFWGALAAAAYAVVALTTLEGFPGRRPLYDGGGPPPPFRWVKPPPQLAAGNQPPSSASDRFPINTPGNSLSTDDGQAVLIIPPGGIAKKAGETTVNSRIDPLDPETLGIAAPTGRSYDGNAYRFTATYAKSGQPAVIAATTCGSPTRPSKCATVVLRYAFNARELYRLDGNAWTKVAATPAGASLQIYGDTPKLGTFVAVDVGTSTKPKARGRSGDLLAFGLGLAAILAGTFLARARAIRRRRRGTATPELAPKGPQPKKRPPTRPMGRRMSDRARRARRWLKR